MYGRADGMPSFQLTVAVCAWGVRLLCYIPLYYDNFHEHLDLISTQLPLSVPPEGKPTMP